MFSGLLVELLFADARKTIDFGTGPRRGRGAAQERCSRRTPAFDPQQTSEQRLPRLGERPRSSDGEAALNDRSGR